MKKKKCMDTEPGSRIIISDGVVYAGEHVFRLSDFCMTTYDTVRKEYKCVFRGREGNAAYVSVRRSAAFPVRLWKKTFRDAIPEQEYLESADYYENECIINMASLSWDRMFPMEIHVRAGYHETGMYRNDRYDLYFQGINNGNGIRTGMIILDGAGQKKLRARFERERPKADRHNIVSASGLTLKYADLETEPIVMVLSNPEFVELVTLDRDLKISRSEFEADYSEGLREKVRDLKVRIRYRDDRDRVTELSANPVFVDVPVLTLDPDIEHDTILYSDHLKKPVFIAASSIIESNRYNAIHSICGSQLLAKRVVSIDRDKWFYGNDLIYIRKDIESADDPGFVIKTQARDIEVRGRPAKTLNRLLAQAEGFEFYGLLPWYQVQTGVWMDKRLIHCGALDCVFENGDSRGTFRKLITVYGDDTGIQLGKDMAKLIQKACGYKRR